MGGERDTVTITDVEVGSVPGPTDPGSLLLERFRIQSVLGSGGYGRVLKAHDEVRDELVAIKVLRDDIPADAETLQRFVREAQAATQLTSEHVARIREVGTIDDDVPYIVMELLEGIDLANLLAQNGRVSSMYAAEMILQACDALAEAHATGIVHRDIKPANIFLATHRDGSRMIKVLDFGVSKMAGEVSLTQTMSVLGTPRYMSPEQTRSAKSVDHRSDIWALGAVLYELVEGRPPFDGDTFAEMCIQLATDEPPPAMVHAPELAPVVARCLEKQLDARYQNLAELVVDLAPYAPAITAESYLPRVHHALSLPLPARPISGVTAAATLTQARAAARPVASRQRAYAIAGGCALVVVIAALAFIVVSGRLGVAKDSADAAPDRRPELATPATVDAATAHAASPMEPDAASGGDAGSDPTSSGPKLDGTTAKSGRPKKDGTTSAKSGSAKRGSASPKTGSAKKPPCDPLKTFEGC